MKIDIESKLEGLKEIDNAQWVPDEYGCLNLFVTDKSGVAIHCFIVERPSYCDRGHFHLNIDGNLNLDGHDSFPRYFFSFKEADNHTRLFLKWRIWKHREHLIDVNWLNYFYIKQK